MDYNTTPLSEQLGQILTNLPWQSQTVSLLMDGINIKNLLHRFYTGENTATFEVLYLQTPFAQLYEVSPCLVKLESTGTPHLQDYLQNLENEWGYLLVSDQSWQQQINHLRNLIKVQLPETNEQIILKLADPQVGKALFSLAEEQQDTKLFGPFSHVYTTDIIDNELNHYQRPTGNIIELHSPYTLSETQNNALDEIEQKRSRHNLYQHMKTYFSSFLSHYPRLNWQEAINQIIQEAEQKGYESPMEKTYYLNIYGYLGSEVFIQHPQLQSLVNQGTLEKVREAAQLAEQLAAK